MKIVFLGMIYLAIIGCSSTPEPQLKKENQLIFTLEEYKKLSKEEKNTGELSIGEKEIALLSKPFFEEKDFKVKPLVLENKLENIRDILKDKNFDREFNANSLERFVYHENMAVAIFYSNNLHNDDKVSGAGYCVGGQEYVFSLEANRLRIRFYDSFSGGISPIEPVDMQ